MADLEIAHVTKRYGDLTAVDDVSLTVADGELVSLLGPSGCGKTTILRMIAGLADPDEGALHIGGTEVTWTPVHRRNLGLVFQSYALFPHMSVFENVAFGLRQRRVGETEVAARVGQALELVRLSGLERRFPREISGGQQQRVALARAIAPRPALLLLDEPLSNLDAKLRDAMRIELRLLQRELSITTVLVTHDQEEALTLSDRVCVLHAGRLQQIGPPREVYEHPQTAFVADFFGRSNSYTGRVLAAGPPARLALESDGVDGRTLEIAASSLPAGLGPGDPVQVTVRRESVAVSAADAAPTDGPEANSFAGTIALTSFAGNALIHMVRLGTGLEMTAELRAGRGREATAPGSAVRLSVAPDDVIVTGL